MAEPSVRAAAPVFRPMAEEDLVRVLEIEAMSFAHPWKRAQFMEELGRHPFSRCLVAVGQAAEGADAGQSDLWGYVLAWEVSDQLHITNLAVHPAHRRRQTARLLLERLFSDARADGAAWCALEVRVSNQAARSLYESLGFVEKGIRRRYYPDGEDALVLVREL